MPWRLDFQRLLVRAKDAGAASKVVTRIGTEMGRSLEAEVVGPYGKEPQLMELRASVELAGATFPDAVVEALDHLERVVVSLADVRVEAAEQSLRAIFAAAERAPIGPALPVLNGSRSSWTGRGFNNDRLAQAPRSLLTRASSRSSMVDMGTYSMSSWGRR